MNEKMYGSKVPFVALFFFTTSSEKICSGYTFRPIVLQKRALVVYQRKSMFAVTIKAVNSNQQRRKVNFCH